MMTFARVLVALFISVCAVNAFVVPCASILTRSARLSPPTLSTRTTSALQMGWGDALNKAFANEDMGSKAKNPGLAREPNTCMVTVNGRTVKAIQGQRLRDVVAAAKAKIEYGCEKGDCGTCESLVDGKKIRICKAVVPRNAQSVTIKTKFG
ncbi:unnamed protein product [Ascophyllum nodosum]